MHTHTHILTNADTHIHTVEAGQLMKLDLGVEVPLSYDERAWNKLSPRGEDVPKRMHHGVTAVNNELYVYGGWIHGEIWFVHA